MDIDSLTWHLQYPHHYLWAIISKGSAKGSNLVILVISFSNVLGIL